MNSTSSVVAAPASGLRERIAGAPWIQSAGFDAALLIFAPLVTLPILIGLYLQIPFLAITCGLVLAFAHYSSTLSFFFWNDSREYHRSRWLAFYVGPLVLVAAYLTLVGNEVPYFAATLLFAWNTFHVARQNCGILAIYRQRAGVADPTQRSAANHAILSISAFLALWNVDTHASVVGLLSIDVTRVLWMVAGAFAAVCMVRLLVALARRQAAIGLPELLFLAASLCFFYPYIFIRDSAGATFAMLQPHYVQYMALVWLLHRRKFGGQQEGAPRPLLALSSRLWLLLPALVAVGYAFYLMRETSIALDRPSIFDHMYVMIALLHFYLDGLIWSFKRPHVRSTIGTFLFRGAPARAPR